MLDAQHLQMAVPTQSVGTRLTLSVGTRFVHNFLLIMVLNGGKIRFLLTGYKNAIGATPYFGGRNILDGDANRCKQFFKHSRTAPKS